ncbi:MAG TPA: hypothetical protein VF062_23390 [Candidatus Limnocylindrales bacterium]
MKPVGAVLERCSAEAASEDAPIELCVRHSASALEMLVEAGAVVVMADLSPALREVVERHLLARQIVDEKLADGTLIRTASGGLIEAAEVAR